MHVALEAAHHAQAEKLEVAAREISAEGKEPISVKYSRLLS